jgi:hypothetical protein
MEKPSHTSAIANDIFTDMVMKEAIKDKTVQYKEELKNQGIVCSSDSFRGPGVSDQGERSD